MLPFATAVTVVVVAVLVVVVVTIVAVTVIIVVGAFSDHRHFQIQAVRGHPQALVKQATQR